MRKRTMSNLADHVFWLLVALLPLVLYVVQFFAYELTTVTTFTPFDTFMTTFGVSTSSVIYTSLVGLFGAEGTLPLFNGINSAPILFLSYFVAVEIIHLAVDFLLFIPRLCHKYMEKFTQGD